MSLAANKRKLSQHDLLGSHGNPPGLKAVWDLGESAHWRENFWQGFGLQVVVVDAVKDDVHDVDQKVWQLRHVGLDQLLHQVEDLSLGPGQHVSVEVDVERLKRNMSIYFNIHLVFLFKKGVVWESEAQMAKNLRNS